MRAREIKKLIELVEQSSISELEVSRWGKKVRISKSGNRAVPAATLPEPAPVATALPASAGVGTAAPAGVPTAEQKPPAPEPTPENIVEIKSPMVGTFYRKPAPDADPYVEVGDIVSKNQVLCIIEAMKLMNEIESDVRGRVAEILVENEQPVEYNQVLFKIEKL